MLKCKFLLSQLCPVGAHPRTTLGVWSFQFPFVPLRTLSHISFTNKTLFIMAKGNLVQGMGRGKLGDIVFSRLDGQQISRVRNRQPHNPKTNKQLYQRMIMATILRAYSAGKAIFDHSFEGQVVGRGCQRYFTSKNNKALRAALAADIAAADATNYDAIIVGPGVIVPTPNEYLVSEGSLVQSLFGITDASADAADALVTLPAPTDGESIADYMTRNRIAVNDIYTFVFFAYDKTGKAVFSVNGVDDDAANQRSGAFAFLRLIAKAPADGTATAAATTLADIFTVDESANIATAPLLSQTLDAFSKKATELVTFEVAGMEVGSFAIIKSDEVQSLRSTETMHFATYPRPYGLSWQFALDGWKQGAVQVGESDLILDGADF